MREPATHAIMRALHADPTFRTFFGDAGVLWCEGRNDRPCQTAEAASNEQVRKLRDLRRHGRDRPEAMRLANLLEQHPRRGSGASHLFMRAFQRKFVAMADACIFDSDCDWSVVSVMHEHCFAAPGQLDWTVFRKLRERLNAGLHAAGISQAIGGFDLSANEHEDRRFLPHYRPQAWILVPRSEIEAGERVFRAQFRSDKQRDDRLVSYPVRIRTWDRDLRGLAYAMKPSFYRRMSLAAGNTRKRELLGRQRVEVALAMHQAGALERLFLYGVRWKRAADGSLRVVPVQDVDVV